MSKPIRGVEINTTADKNTSLDAVFDTGSFYTIIREDCLPSGTVIERYKHEKKFGMARRGAKIRITGAVHLEIKVEKHWIDGDVLVAPSLSSAMLIGAGLMQMWDISIKNKNGHTIIHIGRDMNDPDIQTVL